MTVAPANISAFELHSHELNSFLQNASNPIEAYDQMQAASCIKEACNQDLVWMIKEQSMLEGYAGMIGQHSCSDRLTWLAMMARLGQTAKPTGECTICAAIEHGAFSTVAHITLSW